MINTALLLHCWLEEKIPNILSDADNITVSCSGRWQFDQTLILAALQELKLTSI